MSPDTFELSSKERATLVHGLRVAAGVFDDDAVRAAERGLSAVVQTRQRQAAQAREIADRLEDARYVRVGREVE
jgi:hypothetical protein